MDEFTHTKNRNASKVSLLDFFYRKKVKIMIFSVHSLQNFFSHAKSQQLLVTQHRLSHEKVNLHNTLVT